MSGARNVDLILLAQLAAESETDRRTAKRAVLLGSGAVRGMAGARIARAMQRLGIVDPSPAWIVPVAKSEVTP